MDAAYRMALAASSRAFRIWALRVQCGKRYKSLENSPALLNRSLASCGFKGSAAKIIYDIFAQSTASLSSVPVSRWEMNAAINPA
jgi:hypothetical protein